MRKPQYLLIVIFFIIFSIRGVSSWSIAAPPGPFGAIPSDRQMRWHELQLCAFLHFSPNTFSDREWGLGDEDPNLFNPTDFDADQIVSALQAAGFRGVILTAKHHDGFCLWPTRTTAHSVAHSSWRNGKGDVVKELADACRNHGLKFGIYVSPWDRNNADYGKPEYLRTYREQLRELLTNYGPIFEVWHDGANGGSGYYGGAREVRSIDKRTYYDWPNTWALMRKLQPGAVIFSDAGPDIRWVGNEKGIAGDPCWSTVNPDGIYPGMEGIEPRLNSGDRGGSVWRPAECDVSIRPGWFWHEKENAQVKTPRQLIDLYFNSVGRGASLLLNVPPDRRGRLPDADVTVLKEFGRLLGQTFATNGAVGARVRASNTRGGDRRFGGATVLEGKPDTYWATDDGVTSGQLEFDLAKPTTFNVVRICENVALGQRVAEFTIDTWTGTQWTEFGRGTSVGSMRLIRGVPITTHKVRLRIIKSAASPCINDFGLFLEGQ